MTPDDHPTGPLRAGDEDRERTVATLRRHAGAGRLEPSELDERVDAALRARTRGELEQLTRDLPDEQPRAKPQRSSRDVAVQRFRRHVALWVVFSLFFIAIWAASGGGSFWPVWASLGWAIGLAVHGVKFIGRGDDDGGEERALPRGT